MALEALRLEVGDDDFSAIVRRWAASRAGGNGTTKQFIGSRRILRTQLDDLFETWLYTAAKPPATQGADRIDQPDSTGPCMRSKDTDSVWR